MEKELLEFVWERYNKKFPKNSKAQFKRDFADFEKLPVFKANENIHEIINKKQNVDGDPDVSEDYILSEDLITPETHWIMRMVTQYYITKAFTAMKIDLNDPNINEQSLGKGTPGRIVKMWCGDNLDDTTELGSGRWNKEPYISRFPNTDENHSIITKEVDVVSCCSHHFLPFSTYDGGTAIVEYIPGKYVLGISKLQRFVTWASRRFWLQEDLTQYIGKTISRIAETDDVHIKLTGLVHGCEKFRGAQAKNGSLSTEYKSGYFNKIY